MTYMAVYAGLLFGGACTRGEEQLRRLLYGLFLLLLIVFAAFRYKVGCDWGGYLVIYDAAWGETLANVFTGREPLFAAANILLNQYEFDYPYINLIAAVVYFFGFHRLALRQPDRLGFLILSYPILILNMTMSGIRQAMAIGVLCLAFNAFVDRRLLFYVGFVSIASGFHASALIFLGLAPFVFGRLSPANIALASLIALPGFYAVASSQGFNVFYGRYVGNGADALGAPFRAGLLALTGLVYFAVLRGRWRLRCPRDYELVTIGAAAMLPVILLVPVSSVIADRFGYYLVPIQLIILARAPLLLRPVASPLLRSAPYLALGATLAVWVMASSLFHLCYVPYRSWLFGLPQF